MGFFSDVRRKVEEDMHAEEEKRISEKTYEQKENHVCHGCENCTCGKNSKS